MFKVSIPEISDEEMMKRYEQIKPVITRDGKLYSLKEYSLFEIKNLSYIWTLDTDIREEIPEGKLQILDDRDFICLHRYGYPGFFKPSVGEVLAQLKDYDIPLIRAFEIIEEPETAEDFHKDSFTSIAFDNGYHVSIVRLYQ